jgi:hypothetical protein
MARSVARAIQDLLGNDADQPVKIRLASGSVLMGWLEDLQQFDEAVMLVEPNGTRTVIPMGSIAAVELDLEHPAKLSSLVKQLPRVQAAAAGPPEAVPPAASPAAAVVVS